MPSSLCIFVSAAVILNTFISLGSAVSVSFIRWWQFYNFTQTRQHEKTVLHLIISTLWIIGFGIILGFTSKNLTNFKMNCSLDLLTTTVNETISVALFSITVGFVCSITFNYLTIRKIKQKSPCTHSTNASQQFSMLNFPKILHERNALIIKQNVEIMVTQKCPKCRQA